MEDVWLTGLMRSHLGIKPVDVWWLRGTTVEDLLMIKTVQNTVSYVRDYVTSFPFQRNVSDYRVSNSCHYESSELVILSQVCHMLAQEARRCYHQKCLSNIYHPDTWISKPNLERERQVRSLANSTQTIHVMELYNCARNVQVVKDNSYRICSQQFFRGLLHNFAAAK